MSNTGKAKQSSSISRLSKELLNGQDLLTLIDNLDSIIPLEQQKYTINGEKLIDQRETLKTMARRLRDGKLRTTYLYSKSSKTHGRQYARDALSVQSLSRVLRHTLCSKTYDDYDIKNCHPSIALQYCIKKGWSVPFLQDYVDKRESHIEELVKLNNEPKETFKTMILSTMNGGSKLYKETKFKTDFIRGFYDEIDVIFERIMGLSENENLIKEVREIKQKEKNQVSYNEIRRSVCNRVWVDIENSILNTCIEWCISIGLSIEYIVLMFDGFMLPKTEKMPENWDTLLSDYVYEKIGYRMQFCKKEMNEGVDLSKFNSKTKYIEPVGEVDEGLIIRFCIENSDNHFAELCYEAFGYRYKYDGECLYVFRNHRWDNTGDLFISEDVPTLKSIIEPFENHPELVTDKINYVKKALTAINSDKRIKSMMRFFYVRIYDREFQSKLDSKLGLIGFNNGVYDMNTNTFRNGEPEDYVSLTTGYNYTKSDSCELANKFLTDIIDAETLPCLKSHLAEILYGGNLENKFNFWIGKGGNGKSLLTRAMENVLGQYYSLIPKEIYTKEKKHAGGPEPHLTKLRGSRMVVVAETDEYDRLQTSIFKGTSGGDKIECRGLFQKKVISFRPVFKPVLMSQYLPMFSSTLDDGTIRRLRLFNFPYSFVDNPINEEGIIIQKKRDYDLPLTIDSEEFRNQMLNLILNTKRGYIESSAMVKARESYICQLNPVAEWFYDERYIIQTGDDKDYITNADLFSAYNRWNNNKDINDRHKTITAVKFGTLLNRLVVVKLQRQGDRVFRGINGYKIIDNDY